MKSLATHLTQMYERISNAGVLVLFLDFDGTLSPIAPTPDQAMLPKETKKLLEYLSHDAIVVLVSGRSLQDLEARTRLSGVIIGGNHGLEWQIGKDRYAIPIPKVMLKCLRSLEKELQSLVEEYPGSLLEKKEVAIGLHYRKISRKKNLSFLRRAKAIITRGKNLRLITLSRGKKVLEIRPKIKIHKGTFANQIMRTVRKKYGRNILSIAIGDDQTDEDLFRAACRGICIRVGKKNGSSAQYYVDNHHQVFTFLLQIQSRYDQSNLLG